MAKNTTKIVGEEQEPLKRVRPQHTSLFKNGREYPDPTPVAPPLGFIKQPTLAETMRQMIVGEALRRHARESGLETFDEADDFNVGDDFDPSSPYEETFEPPPQPSPEESYTPLAKAIANELKSAFSGEAAGTAPAAEADPPQTQAAHGASSGGGASPPPKEPFTGFFKR